jgi:tRNA-specific 2-thiouridylase
MKALALLSGGLDSTLAMKVMLEQHIDVAAVSFVTPFCQCSRGKGCGAEARRAADGMGIDLQVRDIGSEFIECVKNPKHGYGKNLNPCIDCRILMHRKAASHMKEVGASFVVTGEVLGQRPMSQHRAALRTIERESGLEGLVLRPLSARLLPSTIPETEGWVDRDRLLEISGRSRKQQMSLAAQFEIADYPCPAGGCLLTDREFCQKMRDLMSHSDITLEDIPLLKLGRHFRLSPGAKLLVGRNEKENEMLTTIARTGDLHLEPAEVMGPVGIGQGEFDEGGVRAAASIVARYCDAPVDQSVRIRSRTLPRGVIESITVEPMSIHEIEEFRIQQRRT